MRSFLPLLIVVLLIQGTVIYFADSLLRFNPALDTAVLLVALSSAAGVMMARKALSLSLEMDRHQRERKHVERQLEIDRRRYRGLFDSIRDAILVADTDRNIIDLNPAFTEIFGYTLDDLRSQKTVVIYASEEEFQELGRDLKTATGGGRFLKTVSYRTKDGKVFPGETGAYFLRDEKSEVVGFIGLIRDVTDRVRLDHEKEELIEELRSALNEVKTLSGLLPICSWCKKIRDDEGYWQQIDSFVSEHSDASFSHGLCPDCMDKHFPET